MWLFGKKKKSDIKPMSYYEAIQMEIKPLEDVMVNLAVSSREAKRTDDRIEILKALVQSFYDLRSKCISMGPEYQKYFSDMWEHCHNSKCDDFCYIDRFEEELNTLQSSANELIARDDLHDQEVQHIEEKVLSILIENPEILQTDVYKKFDPVVQPDIQTVIYSLATEGTIKREKTGRTYKITYCGPGKK